jgi:hypothetical protein
MRSASRPTATGYFNQEILSAGWLNEPFGYNNHNFHDYECGENPDIVAGQPFGKIDIKISLPFLGVLGGNFGYGAGPPIDDNNKNLHRQQRSGDPKPGVEPADKSTVKGQEI